MHIEKKADDRGGSFILKLFKKKKNERAEEKGIVIKKDVQINDDKDTIYRYLLNGLLIFCETYACIMCFISAFKIPVYKIMFTLTILVFSILFALMHLNKKTRGIGYAAVFISYIFMVFNWLMEIKSGFAVMVNTVMEYMEGKFSIPLIKRYSIYIDDARLGVTICIIVIGFVIALVLNIIISEFMNIRRMLIITFPIAQIGMYFDLMPDFIPAVMYMAVPFVMIITKMNRKYSITSKKTEFGHIDKDGVIYKNYTTSPKVLAQLTGVSCVAITLMVVVISLVVAGTEYGSDYSKKKIKESTNVYVREFAIKGFAGLFGKNQSSGGLSAGEELGKNSIVSLDFETDLEITYVPVSSERMYLKGYVGVNYINNSWRTINNSSYNDDNIQYYLNKKDKYYSTIALGSDKAKTYINSKPLEIMNISGMYFAELYNYGIGTNKYKANMDIKVCDMSNIFHFFRPYGAVADNGIVSVYFDEDTLLSGMDIIEEYDKRGYNVEYYPYEVELDNGYELLEEYYRVKDKADDKLDDSGQNANEYDVEYDETYEYETEYEGTNDKVDAEYADDRVDEYGTVYEDEYDVENVDNNARITDYDVEEYIQMYDRLAYLMYLDVPAGNYEQIHEVCQENGFYDYNSIEEAVQWVSDYFEANYEYSLRCGSIPEGSDFINYFLEQMESGYCVHFTSAAVLIFRQLGIPARYVEGYVIDAGDIWDGKVVNTNRDKYLVSNEKIYNDELKPVKVEINDSSAHSWVELYVDGIGWTPVEVTPPSESELEDAASGGFLSSILSFLYGDGGEEKEEEDSDEKNDKEFSGNIGSVKNYTNIISLLFVAVIIILPLLVIMMFIKEYSDRKKAICSEDANTAIMASFEYFRDVLDVAGYKKDTGMLDVEFFDTLTDIEIIDVAKLKQIYSYIESAKFGNKIIDNNVKEEIVRALLGMAKDIYKNIVIKEKKLCLYRDVKRNVCLYLLYKTV